MEKEEKLLSNRTKCGSDLWVDSYCFFYFYQEIERKEIEKVHDENT